MQSGMIPVEPLVISVESSLALGRIANLAGVDFETDTASWPCAELLPVLGVNALGFRS